MTTPPGASAKNIRFVSRCDQGGRSDGVQVIVHKGHAFIGHMFSDGFSVVDVRDPLQSEDGGFRRGAEKHPLASSANPRRRSARRQRPEYLGDAAICQPAGLLRQVADRLGSHRTAVRGGLARLRHVETGKPARDRASSPCRASARIASGGSAAATPMSRCISRASSTTLWR